MTVWMVRAGKYGEREETALEKGLAVVGWDELPDLRTIESKKKLEDMLPKVYPGSSPMKLTVWAGQLWSFRERIAVDDIIALPLKKQAAIALGRVSGPYEYHATNPPGARHARAVEWVRKDVPRSSFESDLLFSLGSTLTVCQIKRNDAEKRIRTMLGAPGRVSEPSPAAALGEEPVEPLDVEEYASDRVRDFVVVASRAMRWLV